MLDNIKDERRAYYGPGGHTGEHGLIHMYIIMVVDMVEAEDMIALEL